MSDKLDTLKTSIEYLHRAAEQSPFSQSLLRGGTDKDQYLTYLRALAIIHGVLETRVTKTNCDLLRAVWRDEMKKLDLLEEDISHLDPAHSRMEDYTEPVSIALECAEKIRVHSLQSPEKLLGYLYVLEGSTNGGRFMYPRIREGLGLSGGKGTAYFRNYGDDQPRAWKDFKERVETHLSAEALEEACDGAKELFSYIVGILNALNPQTVEKIPRKVHATAFNPEAGTHSVVQEKKEIEAVMNASVAVLKKIPYVEMRFGKRGIRYTESNGAWLATLVHFSPETIISQVRWLAKILSPIGIPRYALEMHLRETERCLKALNPGRSSEYHKLSLAADALRDSRNEVLPQADEDDLISEFLSKVEGLNGPCRDEIFGRLLISSAADEILGPQGGLDTTQRWIEEEFLLEGELRNAALQLLDKASSQCRAGVHLSAEDSE